MSSSGCGLKSKSARLWLSERERLGTRAEDEDIEEKSFNGRNGKAYLYLPDGMSKLGQSIVQKATAGK